MRARFLAPLLAGALLVAIPGALPAQEERIVIRPEPGNPVVAVELLLATGPADETPEQAGIAYLTARTAVAPLRQVMDSLGVYLAVNAQKEALAFTLIAAPDVWEEASRRLLAGLFRDPVDAAAAQAERGVLRAELSAREASPADALAREADAAFFGEDHPWGRPAVGYASTVEGLQPADVEIFLRRNFTPDRATIAVAGPLETLAARSHLRTLLGAAPLEPPPPPDPRPVAEAVRRPYGSITAWVSAGYRFRPDADVEALRMLAWLAGEEISFGPSRRSVYNARSEVRRFPGGGELRLVMVVPPQEAEQWAERLRAAVAEFARQPMSPTRFAELLRRYRGARLQELDTPEARARLMAQRLLLSGRRSGPLVGTEDLSPERLHAAGRALDAPVVVFLGPFEDEAAQEGAGS